MGAPTPNLIPQKKREKKTEKKSSNRRLVRFGLGNK